MKRLKKPLDCAYKYMKTEDKLVLYGGVALGALYLIRSGQIGNIFGSVVSAIPDTISKTVEGFTSQIPGLRPEGAHYTESPAYNVFTTTDPLPQTPEIQAYIDQGFIQQNPITLDWTFNDPFKVREGFVSGTTTSGSHYEIEYDPVLGTSTTITYGPSPLDSIISFINPFD